MFSLDNQTGVSVQVDFIRLEADCSVDGTGAMDLGVLAGEHLGVPNGQRSLAGLAARLLNRHLTKDGVRTSDWEQFPLTPNQVGDDVCFLIIEHYGL